MTAPGAHVEIVIEAVQPDPGTLTSAVWLADRLLCQRQASLPAEVADIWSALRLPAAAAGERLAEAGRGLAGALFDDEAAAALARMLLDMPPGDTAEVVLRANGAALSLPVELIRLPAGPGAEAGPLGLLPGVAVSRRLLPDGPEPGAESAPVSAAPQNGLPGPLKILAAVAAPDETKTASAPLDSEAEMQAVLDAVTDVTAGGPPQVRVLEVASLSSIRQALAEDAYHVLHLSAHGSPRAIELEDEDGGPVLVTPPDLADSLHQSGRPLPLIVLSSCSGGAAGAGAMAAALIANGADRVIAMLAPVTEVYAAILARHLYSDLAAHPSRTAGQALAVARYLAAEDQGRQTEGRPPVPEYGVPTLFGAGADRPLVEPGLPPRPLRLATTPPRGQDVLQMAMGTLIGRRAELRAVMDVLRRVPPAVRQYGQRGGVMLTGIGGIGKTAVAGRAITRLRDDGWAVAVHEGRWDPGALIAAVAAAAQLRTRAAGPGRAAGLEAAVARLHDHDDDSAKMATVADLLARERILLVLDDFDQNLAPGGQAFADPGVAKLIGTLSGAARTGALLITCRHPLPGMSEILAEVRLPPLSPAELRRLFLRLPALRDLDSDDRRLIVRAIGGHPRLIEFTDALLRHGHSGFRHVQVRLRSLARAEGVNLGAEQSVAQAVDQAILLGSADILLSELTRLLAPAQVVILRQIAVSRAPMTLHDLASAIPADAGEAPGPDALAADVTRLSDLTLLGPGPEIVMPPWTAELVVRDTGSALDAEHTRALAMRWRRLDENRGDYLDLLDITRHLAALGRYEELVGIARQTGEFLTGTRAVAACLAEIRSLIPRTERSWTVVARYEAEALLQAGDLPAATAEQRLIHELEQVRADAEPGNAQFQHDLAVSHEHLGHIAVAAGDLDAARGQYQAALEITARLAAAEPGGTREQLDLTAIHDRLGAIALTTGDLAAARIAFQASLDIRERLAAAEPANGKWQHSLSVSHEKLGAIATAAKNLPAARAAFQASLDIRKRLAATYPADTERQRDLAISYEKLGNASAATGDLATARVAYQANLDIAAKLAASDPANARWQQDLSMSHEKQADVELLAGDAAAARAAYRASRDIRERLADTDPTNTGWQDDLSAIHQKLGNVAVAVGDLSHAREAYQVSLAIRQRLAARDQANLEWQRDLSILHDALADIAVSAGDLVRARHAYQESLDIAVRLTALNPDNAEWQRDLSISHEKLGDVAAASGDLSAARQAYQASLAIQERLAAANPANAQLQHDLSLLHNALGDVAAASGDLSAARQAYQASLRVLENLAAADTAGTRWQQDVSAAQQKLRRLPA